MCPMGALRLQCLSVHERDGVKEKRKKRKKRGVSEWGGEEKEKEREANQ